MYRLEQRHIAAYRRRRKKPERTAYHTRLVGQYIAEHILGHHHVEERGTLYQLHGGVIHEHEIECHILIFRRHIFRHLAPQTRRSQHIGLIDDGEVSLTRHSHIESHTYHAFHFYTGIDATVERTGAVLRPSARLSEIYAARKLTHKYQIDTLYPLASQRRPIRQCRKERQRTYVGKEPQ